MEDVKYYTQEGLDALKRELNELEAVERPKISQAIAEARDKGDLSEMPPKKPRDCWNSRSPTCATSSPKPAFWTNPKSTFPKCSSTPS